MKSNAQYWDMIFAGTQEEKLGWHEKDALKTFELLNKIPTIENATIFLVGAGTSIIIEQLINSKAQLIINDISIEALNKVKKRLKTDENKVNWFCHDISLIIKDNIPNIDIWIDRAVLHFLTTEASIKGYFKNIKNKLKINGYVVFAEFAKTGADKCAGLILHRYSITELSQRLGASFKLIASFNYTYINPNGEQKPYIYGLYQRIK